MQAHSSKRWGILAIVSSALFLIVTDMTVLYTALPTLTQALHANASQKLWIVNTYALVAAGLLLSTGALGDKLGHKRMFIVGLVVFGLASLMAAYASSAAVLIAARALLAVGAATMMPSTLSIVRLVFSDERERAVAIGLWAAVASGGAALGPVVGGFLLEYFWWGSVFLINVPVAAVALVLAAKLIPAMPGDASRHWDGWSSILVMVGLVGLAYAIKSIGIASAGWTEVGISAVVGSVFLAWFVRRQNQLPQPMLDFAIFKTPGFLTCVIAALLASATLVGLELVLSQRLQLVRSLSPLETSFYLLPLPLAALVAGPISGALLHKVGNMRMLAASLLVAAIGMAGSLAAGDAYPWLQASSLTVLGLGVGAVISAVSTTLMNSVAPEYAGTAASVEEVSYELGGAIGVSVLGSLLSAVYAYGMASAAAANPNAPVSDSLEAALWTAKDLADAQSQALVAAAHAAFESAYQVSLWICTALLVGMAAWVYVKEVRAKR